MKNNSNSSIVDNIEVENARWSFGGKTPEYFDKHINKSVPLYMEGQNIICELGDFFIKDDSTVYDIGTSTGEMLYKIAEHNNNKNVEFIGIDTIAEMIDVAKGKNSKKNLNISFENKDLLSYEFSPANLIISYYTMQFIHPNNRQFLINNIYNALNWGGAFIMFEKVRAPDARFQDITSSLYKEFKFKNGYSAEEILMKERSLKGILEPFSTQGNIDMLKRAGFEDIMTISKFINFEGFLAIK